MAAKYFYLIAWSTLVLANVLALVEEPPPKPGLHLVEQPKNVIVVRNQQLLLPCSAVDDNGLAVNITWLKDGELLNERRRHVLNNGSLLIRRVFKRKDNDKNDEGKYECLAKTAVGIISSPPADVHVASLEQFSKEPEDIRVTVGELARFECFIQGTPDPEITWEKHRQPLQENERYTVLHSGVLQISNVQKSDIGHYRCHASNTARTRQSREAYLEVDEGRHRIEPKLLAGPELLSSKVGESVVFECAVTSIPQVSIIWRRGDGKDITGTRFQQLGEGNLKIVNISTEDEGTYLCAISKPNSQATVITQTRLTVLVAPKLAQQPEDVQKPLALTARFTCRFTGSPPLIITWLKNGQPLKSNGRIKMKLHDGGGRNQQEMETGMLTIQLSVTGDSGLYQCRAENAAGFTQATARLYIKPSVDAPDPPRNLRAQSVSSTSISLQWDPSPVKNGLPILAYSVHFVPTAGGAEHQRVVTVTSLLIDQLPPYTEYTLYLVAYNEVSASEHSQTITERTGEDVPISAPRVKLSSVSPTSIKVEWTELALHEARGRIAAYRILYRKVHQPDTNVININNSSVREFTITDLEPGRTYEIRVLAGTKHSFPTLDDRDWPWQTQNTGAGTKVSAPEVEVIVLNSTAIEINWRNTKIAGHLIKFDGYKINYQRSGQKMLTVIVTQNTTTFTLMNLAPNTIYNISLVAYKLQEKDVQSPTYTVRTMTSSGLPELPDSETQPMKLQQPVHLNAIPLNDTSISLTWNYPANAGKVTHFKVSCSQVLFHEDRELRNTSKSEYYITDELGITVVTLKPFALYEFSVRALSKNKTSLPSNEVRCKTKEGKPTAPQHPNCVSRGSMVELNWEPPRESNGIIRSYIIYYQMDVQMPDDSWEIKNISGTQTSAVIKDLEGNTNYYFKLSARTSGGVGPPSDAINVHIFAEPNSPTTSVHTNDRLELNMANERKMGIIVGACIGLACIIICAIIILLRNRCCPPRTAFASHNTPCRSNGCVPQVNSNGYLPNGHGNHRQYNQHEMESFLPMLLHLPENQQSDAKGGYDYYRRENGRSNGKLPVNGIRSIGPSHKKNGIAKGQNRHDWQGGISSDDDCPEVPLRSTSLHDKTPENCHRRPHVEHSMCGTWEEPNNAQEEARVTLACSLAENRESGHDSSLGEGEHTGTTTTTIDSDTHSPLHLDEAIVEHDRTDDSVWSEPQSTSVSHNHQEQLDQSDYVHPGIQSETATFTSSPSMQSKPLARKSQDAGTRLSPGGGWSAAAAARLASCSIQPQFSQDATVVSHRQPLPHRT